MPRWRPVLRGAAVRQPAMGHCALARAIVRPTTPPRPVPPPRPDRSPAWTAALHWPQPIARSRRRRPCVRLPLARAATTGRPRPRGPGHPARDRAGQTRRESRRCGTPSRRLDRSRPAPVYPSPGAATRTGPPGHVLAQAPAGLQIAFAAEAQRPVAADDQMVVDGQPQNLCRIAYLVGDKNVGL